MTIDFGPEVGTKISCGAFTNYSKEQMLGKTVICVLNFGTKKMGPEISEALTLGLTNAKGETIYLTTESEVPLGGHVF
jgi:tRNA-binding protein